MDAATEAKVNAAYDELALHFEQWETVKDMVDQATAKMGERIVVKRFARFQVGES